MEIYVNIVPRRRTVHKCEFMNQIIFAIDDAIRMLAYLLSLNML